MRHLSLSSNGLAISSYLEAFEEIARTRPQLVAVIDATGAELTYGELEKGARRVAQELIANRAAGDSCVGVCLDRDLNLYVGLVGVSRAGAAYVSLDPTYPDALLETMLATADAKMVVMRGHSTDQFPHFRGTRIRLP